MARLRTAVTVAPARGGPDRSGWALRRALPPAPAPSSRPEPSTALLSGDDPGGFALATAPRAFRFPDDHGPHPEFRHEWWYFTGNLKGPGGGGSATSSPSSASPSLRRALLPGNRVGAPYRRTWPTFSVTDARGNGFRHFERTGRGAMGLAGAGVRPFRVWIDDWSAEGGAGLPDADPAARDGERGLRGPPPRLGQAADSPGGPGTQPERRRQGNASHYYSITRIATRGTVAVDGTSYRSRGTPGWTANGAPAPSGRSTPGGTGSPSGCPTAAT